jgi:uncharacterized protein YdiU (UPF0061 family)
MKLLGLLSIFVSLASWAEGPSDTNFAVFEGQNFRDLVTTNHFDPLAAEQMTLGIETEAGGLPTEKVVASLIRSLGGKYVGEETSGTEKARVIEGSKIGKIKIEPVNLNRLLNRFRATHPGTPLDADLVTRLTAWVDRQVGTYEIVTEPLHYSQVQEYSLALDKLGLDGAKGTKIFLRQVSTQVNAGLDPKDIDYMKQILLNYYDNSGNIRADINPTLSRRGYLGHVTSAFMAKLKDPNWHPSSQEFYNEYLEGSPHKLSRLNLFNATLMDPDNLAAFKQPATGKQVLPRPVAEFREADTVASTPKDPTAASRSLMKEVDFAVALSLASHEGNVTFDSETKLAAEKIAQAPSQEPLRPINAKLRDTIDPKYYTPLKTRPLVGADVPLVNPSVLDDWGLTGTDAEVQAQILDKFGKEIDDSENPLGTRSDNPTAPFATAHNDKAGGVGDGRAFLYDEMNGDIPSAKGIKRTPYTMKPSLATFLKLHTGGTDGRMKFKEGIRTWLVGEILHSYGITSEQAAALIDNHAVSEVPGKAPSPSGILIRKIPGGAIRNSHVYLWDTVQNRRGLEYLKEYASAHQGSKFTDSTYVAFDASQSGIMAARMQDAYIVHGALAKGNVLAYPGLVDIAGMTFLDKPDPEFIGFAYLSRMGNQANRLRELMLERQRSFAKSNQTIMGVHAGEIFDQAYQKELALLNAQRLGMTREQAEAGFERNPKGFLDFSSQVWKMQYGHLNTDLRTFLAKMPSSIQNGKSSADLLSQSNAVERETEHGRREWITNAKNKVAKRNTSMSDAEAQKLFASAQGLINDAVAHSSASLAEMDKVAGLQFERRPPTMAKLDKTIDDVMDAKKNGGDVPTAIEKARHFLTDIDQTVSQAATIGAGTGTSVGTRSVAESEPASDRTPDAEVACAVHGLQLSMGEKLHENSVGVARIQNQDHAPTCMACSATGSLENAILAKTGEKIPLSTPYLVAHGAEIRLKQLYDSGELTHLPGYAQLRIVDQDFIFKAAHEDGVVPESAWQPKKSIHDWDDKVMNLKLTLGVLLEDLKNGKMTPEQVMAEFHKKVIENTGPLPESFVYEGKTYTPQQFAKEKLPPLQVEQLQVQGHEDENKNVTKYATSSRTAPLNQVVETAASQIDKGFSVPIVVTYNGMYRKGDVMKVDGKPQSFNPRKVIKRDFRHGMIMVGYERDAAGNIDWLKVQDSRGEETGDHGIIRIHRTYFAPFLRRIQLFSDASAS